MSACAILDAMQSSAPVCSFSLVFNSDFTNVTTPV